MRPARILLGILVYATTAYAQLAIDNCQRFEWDCPDCTDMGAFKLYASQTSGVYPFVRRQDGTVDPQQSHATLTIPAFPVMVTEALCADVALMLTTEGQWFAVVTLVSNDWSQESDPSNEVSFTFRNQTTLPPIPPHPRPPHQPPPPLPGAPPPPPPVKIPPVVRHDNAPFTQTEMFQGVGRTIPPTRRPPPLPAPCEDPPGVKFAESCMFRGPR